MRYNVIVAASDAAIINYLCTHERAYCAAAYRDLGRPYFGLISAASARDRHRAAKVLVSFNAMESLAGRSLIIAGRSRAAEGGGGVRAFCSGRERALLCTAARTKLAILRQVPEEVSNTPLPAFGTGCPLPSPGRTLSVRASRFRTGRDHIKATVGRALSTIRRALPSFVTPQPI